MAVPAELRTSGSVLRTQPRQPPRAARRRLFAMVRSTSLRVSQSKTPAPRQAASPQPSLSA